MYRRRTVRLCLLAKRAEQIAAEVKSISVTNPPYVIIHTGMKNLPTVSEHECAKHDKDLAINVLCGFLNLCPAAAAFTGRPAKTKFNARTQSERKKI